MSRLRVFLADDHPLILDGLRLLINLQEDMEVIGQAGDGKETWHSARALQPDVLVTDLSMPRMGGAQATELLKRDCPSIKVLALTVHEDQSYLRQLLALGASGYVLKRSAAHELPQAIRIVAAGGIYLDAAFGDRFLAAQAAETLSETRPAHLGEREGEVLRLIAWGHTNKEIAAQLHISVKTVETHKARLMEKLNLHSRADIVRYALSHGWMLEAAG